MTTTRLWWVRHGPTHQTAFTGWRDVPADLSDTAKLARLDAYLPANATLISSDLRRASTTADAIAATRKRLPDDAQLRELNFGIWDGVAFSTVAQTHPELSRAYWETPGDIAPPDGESWNDLQARLAPAVTKLLATKQRDIIIVAHIGVILSQLQRALGITPYKALSHKIEPLSVTRIDITKSGQSAPVINHEP